MRISVDVGYGFIKAVNENGKTIDFPSVVEMQIGSDVTGSLGIGVEEDYRITMIDADGEESKKYLVGDAAMSMGGQRAFDDQAINNRHLDVLISTAVLLLLEDTEEQVELAVGLPMKDFVTQKKDLEKRLSNFKQVISYKNKSVEISIGTVFVFPQGAGTYYSAIFDINGEVKNADLLNQAVAVIDVGHRTTDYIFMTETRKGLTPVPSLTGSLDFGMKNVLKLTTDNVYEEHKKRNKKNPKAISVDEVEKAILWKGYTLKHQGEVYTIEKIYARSAEKVANDITDVLKRHWSDKIDTLAAVIIGGGGGDSMYNHFVKLFNDSTVRKVDEPRFANANGYLAAQAQVLRRKS